MRVFFTNLGCKLNQAELEDLSRRFVGAGYRLSGSLAEADLHVVNTCTVTHVAARDSRKVARRGRRHNPNLRTVLTGCYVAAEPEAAARLAGVDLVVPNDRKHELVERVRAAFPEEAPPGTDGGPLPIPYVPLEFGNARALVKVEDGCNMRCAFCIIPRTRGPQRSRPLAEVVAETRALAAGGFQEIVVTGVQISAYRDRDRRLYDLVVRLLRDTPVRRLRLTSIAPWQFDPRLLELFEGGRLCRHVHLSLQSGCDRTLARMRRPYGAEAFAGVVESIRRAVPGVAITTDVIVGFPGETRAEFEESLDMVAATGFARVHAFPYSARPGTEAANLPGQVDHRVKRRRMARLLALAADSERRFWSSQLGRPAEALWERRRDGRWVGTTDHYIRVIGPAGGHRTGRLESVALIALGDDGVFAEPLDTRFRTVGAGLAPAREGASAGATRRPDLEGAASP